MWVVQGWTGAFLAQVAYHNRSDTPPYTTYSPYTIVTVPLNMYCNILPNNYKFGKEVLWINVPVTSGSVYLFY